MVAILNFIPVLIVSVFLYAAARSLKLGRVRTACCCIFGLILVLFVYFQIQPSYMPKGSVQRTETIGFDDKKITPTDSLSKPISGKERDEVRKRQYDEKLPFLSDKSAK